MKSLRILVLDRNLERRDELVGLLRGADHHAVATSDPPSAAESIDPARFDALLLDLASADLDLALLRQAVAPAASEPGSLEEAERRHLALALRHTAGNKRRAALLLGISRSTLLNKVRKYGLAPLATLICWATSPVRAQTHAPIPPGELSSGTLSFEGHATVGDFVGTTDSVSGQMMGGPNISAVRGWVEAPVRTLKTGDRRRDKDLNKSMESNKYPTMRFELTGATPRAGTADSLTATLHGNLTIHGVSRKADLPSTLVFQKSSLRVRSEFPLNLKDYRIGGLSKMLGMLKMSEKIEVQVDLLFGLDQRT
jgi:polyisoprenoid-binding protein YceI/CheY-like chemotaxis protein